MNKPLRRTGLAVSIALVAAFSAGTVNAQSQGADDEVIEEIITTGIRGSIQRAIDFKQSSNSIIEAVSAEDLGRLPDTSIADAISRLPGLTSQRAEGRASAVSLRGTDPGFTTALLNGREQVSTGDNRSVEFDQYPSELLNAVLVYKTPDSGLVGQGLAGTIDLRTVRPLDYGNRAVAINVRGEMNGNDNLGADSDEMGSRISFSYIDQFADGTIGLALGYARLDSPLATQGFGTYDPWGAVNLGNPDQNAGVPEGTSVTNGMKVRADLGSTERNGFMAALQFAPSDNYTGVIDLYYSTMEQTNNARSLEVNLGGYPAPCCDGVFPDGTQFGYSNVTVENGVAVAGNVLQVLPLARNFLFLTDDEILSTGFNNEFFLSDDWTLKADLSYSKATRKQDQFETQATYVPDPPQFDENNPDLVRFQYDTGTFRLNGTSSMPTLSFTRDYTDADQVYIGNTIYGPGYSKAPRVEDEITSFRVDLVRTAEWGWFEEFALMANYSERTKDKIGPETGLGTIDNDWYRIEDRFLVAPMNLDYAGAGQALAWDVMGVLNEYFNPIVYGDPTTLTYLAGKYWDVQEDVWTVALRGNLFHELSGDVTLMGNIGVQVIGTDQSSGSFLVANGGTPEQEVVRFSDGKSYEHVLPQINLVFAMGDNQAVRVGLAQEIARARMDQLKATIEAGYNSFTGEPGGSGGNPLLDPWEAWAFDVSYERYFGEGEGYVSVAAFYKDLETYIYDQTIVADFTPLLEVTPPDYFQPGVVPETTGLFTRPVNGSGGYLQGLEFATSIPFNLFTEALDGFGAQFSYSYTDSDIAIAGSINQIPIDSIPLPGLSQDVWNLTLYFEKYGFAARVNTRYRSEYIGEVTNFANERGFRFVDSDQITDAQFSYSFQGDRLSGLQLLFQINNLTNEPYIAYSQVPTRVMDYQEYGTQYLLGLNYRF
ncbi:MAG: TonB-dependent receptor [Gammaproteobacteria bacterium]|nr:TonB-dependent receptor [Gammaproteobacteria bacterium]